jgi:hypothetical protein
MQIRRKLKNVAHLRSVENPVGLRTRRLDGQTSGAIEQPKLNARAVNDAAHNTA